ncbi:MAG: triose-phosphate isomerase [bacterium]|nr:triose-phosphate isomerase [bacterium]MDZ4231225.1 triose-phosphate isomerase [Patescibacteria group bacterium]
MKLVVGNWKLNPTTAKEAVELARATDLEGAVLCPPDIFLMQVGEVLEKASLGAQDIFYEDGANITGEVSAVELKKSGVRYVIVGHSSRREKVGETDWLINLKAKAALSSGLKTILCVGESLDEHQEGKDRARAFVLDQFRKDLADVGTGKENLIVAYEPIWSISTSGTGLVDTPQDAALMIGYIKEELGKLDLEETPVIYGGSVNAETAKGFLVEEVIDGVLVGGASLDPDEFKKIASFA